MESAITAKQPNSSKLVKGLYWGSTGLISAMMLFSAFSYLTNESMAAGFQHLGYPSYFRIELAIAKIIGVAVLLMPGAERFKEWAYAGFGITFVSAFIAHTSVGDPVQAAIAPVIAFALLATSYSTRQRARSKATT